MIDERGVRQVKCRNRSCKCRTCLKNNAGSPCGCGQCKGKRKKCRNYEGYKQVTLFPVPSSRMKYKAAPRVSWEEYGLGKARQKELCVMCQSGKYDDIVRRVAKKTNEEISEYIVKSVTKDKSYDRLEFDGELGRICVGKTDFYGYRRYFYHLLDEGVKELEKMSDNVRWLTTCPATDGNFKYRLQAANDNEIREAITIMEGAEGNVSRISACSRELKKRERGMSGKRK